jgi:glycosyltransferase involved in cell wall biosynthesis
MDDDIFVGVTTWNSEQFIPHCLQSIRRTTDGLRVHIGVVDNDSQDSSADVAREFGAEVRIERCSQAIALNRLLAMSSGRFTLLLHSDVVLLSPSWFAACTARMKGNVALVSPEDIGCGPLTRDYGIGMPESCFMLFDTAMARRARTLGWTRRRGIPWPRLHLDLDHYYVTHHLPRTLARRGLSWQPMRVHASPRSTVPVYEPPFTPEYWSEELSFLRYGMGNFYSLDGCITHYHNWFDRAPKDVPLDSRETTEGGGKGLPLAYLSLCTRTFIADLEAGRLTLPSPDEPPREPRRTTRHVPDLNRPFAALRQGC